jgi:hypothetical protein
LGGIGSGADYTSPIGSSVDFQKLIVRGQGHTTIIGTVSLLRHRNNITFLKPKSLARSLSNVNNPTPKEFARDVPVGSRL